MTRWTVRCGALLAAWIAAGWLIVPAIIRSAFADGIFGFLSPLMPGRDVHTVDVYLAAWRDLALPILVGLTAVWLLGLVLMHPKTRLVAGAAYSRVPTFSGRVHRRTVALALAVVTIAVAMQLTYVPGEWETARGHEYERIAGSLAAGQGFSFPPGLRWLYIEGEPGDAEYGATAWKEPLYPAFIAISLSTFGDRYGRLVVAIVQLGFLVGTCLLIYHLGCRLFSPGVGVMAALLAISLPDLHYIHVAKMQVPGISGLLLVGGLLLMLKYADGPSVRRAAFLGAFLGAAALAHAVLLVLIPIGILYVLLNSGGVKGRESLRRAAVVCLAATLAIAPWTTRNYLQFGHLIPVQTGFGLFANVSNSYIAESYMPQLDACRDGSEPVFRAEGPFDAVRTFQASELTIHAVHRRAVGCVAAAGGKAYFERNEHERDALHRAQLAGFVRDYPAAFVELTAVKGLTYLVDFPVRGRGLPLMAVLGLVGIAWTALRPRLWVFPVAILAYAMPFAVGAPMYFRYQAPLEPLYALFAVGLVAALLMPLFELVREKWIRMLQA